ncbi:MAG: winged helix-turn-helix domain-containing protein [Candidatus Woesearchaeota archaeon]|jgi:predicted transcriptional regulator
MERKRTRLDIIADMLTSIRDKGNSIKPTHLMYKSNLSHSQMKGYLEELIDKSFIEKVKRKDNDYIIITDKGFEFLSKFKEMREFESAFGL